MVVMEVGRYNSEMSYSYHLTSLNGILTNGLPPVDPGYGILEEKMHLSKGVKPLAGFALS